MFWCFRENIECHSKWVGEEGTDILHLLYGREQNNWCPRS